jgi:cobyrinic acid a,c-diamide synthase
VKIPCLGGLLRNKDLGIPERHLGLVTREDHPLDDVHIRYLADVIDGSLDIENLLARLPVMDVHPPMNDTASARNVRIGVARDKAFCFYYPDNLEILEEQGAEVIPFSPMEDDGLPPDVDGLYLGGGYPELNAETLAGNAAMLAQIRASSARGMPIYAECGGFMYLCERLTDQAGRSFPMAGCFPFTTRMLPRLKALGYRQIQLTRATILGGPGLSLRGHEFHYSELVDGSLPCDTVYRISDRGGSTQAAEGYLVRHTLGSYIHLHFGSEPNAARHFIENCRAYQAERKQGL